ncbi:hypothetical protein [Salipiger pallidus]|uniref:hypothetical protein n=1 Tax=Salipiger pallidus TaxID=1775170 RepID=UPI0016687A5D|nr:hypothetical protein [Salipiger pallidus]
MNIFKFRQLGVVFVLVACGPITNEPAVSFFNEASVAVQLNAKPMSMMDDASRERAIQKADRLAADTCRRGPHRGAEFVSSQDIPTGRYTSVIERLYLCLR